MTAQAKSLQQPPIPGLGAGRQRGVVLFFALIVLVILLIGGITVARSINASLLGAGNLAFRRDLVTQSDAVVARALHAVAAAGSGATDAIADLTTNQQAFNYSAKVLPADTQGIPSVLFNDGDFDAIGNTENDMPGPEGSKVVTRYVIERMCDQTGPVTADNCVRSLGNTTGGGHNSSTPPPLLPGSVVYRLSARVTGPRDTQAFFQTMFSGPG